MRPPDLNLEPELAAQSPLDGRALFLLATPDSGAERLLRALACFPGVAAAPVPTHVFSQGVGRVLEHWRLDEGPQALSGLASEQELLLASRLLADAPLVARLEATGGERVVEYSPDHISHADEIAGLYPDACLIHVVRDGRQVAARLSSPAHGWPARHAARRWIDDQRAVQAIEHPNLYVVRIEDLLRDPARLLAALVPHLGLDPAPDSLELAAAAVGAARPLPTVREGRAGAVVEIVGSDLLHHFDYQSRNGKAPQYVAAWGDMLWSGSSAFGRRVATEVVPDLAGRARSMVRGLAGPRRS